MANNNLQNWKSPIIRAILEHHESKGSIEKVIDFEIDKFLESYSKQSKALFTLPIENIAKSLNVSEIKTITQGHGVDSIYKLQDGTYHIDVNKKYYYYYRYALAHEISHLLLRKLAGPLPRKTLTSDDKIHKEEEAVCDYFASSLLVPTTKLKDELKSVSNITNDSILKLSKKFSVSRKILINRIAQLNSYLVLYWDKIKNPNSKNSRELLRINDLFPNRENFAKYFIPKYCSANKKRFSPNIILDSFHQGQSLEGIINISNLGSLPSGEYKVSNIFVSYWDNSFFDLGLIRARKNFYTIFSLINLNNA